MVIILSEECLSEIDNEWAKLSDIGSTKRASKNPRLLVTDSSSPPSFEMALDLSTRDPFCGIDDFINEQLQQQQVVALAAEDVEPAVMLSSGHTMPVIGLAVSQMVGEMKQHAICDLMSTVIAMGYRHFDCTSDFDTEMKIGKALAEACQTQLVKRKDLFITAQVPYKNPGNVIETCKRTLRNLQLDYVDLYLVSIPHSGVADSSDTAISLERTWNAMEELVSMGLVNSIGISNCDIFLIRDLLAYAKINPAISQIRIHPYLQRDPLVKFCQKHKMCVIALSPDSDGLEPFLKDTVIKDLTKKYSKTPAQVVLRWLLQRSMAVISGISRVDVLKDCLPDLFDFNISAEDMKVIQSLDRT
ncbi:unnamed protein product [Urochloa humidicola]